MNKFLKVLLIMLCAVVLVVLSVAGTLAYLSVKTDPVTNTFTAGNINIELEQTGTLDKAKIIPGKGYAVDPVVTVKEGSEACWLFVQIDKFDGFDNYFTYTVLGDWRPIADGSNVYYRQMDATSVDTPLHILQVKTEDPLTTLYAKSTLTKKQCNDLNSLDLDLTLNFTAYAVQSFGVSTLEEAWTIAQSLNTANPPAGEVIDSEG